MKKYLSLGDEKNICETCIYQTETYFLENLMDNNRKQLALKILATAFTRVESIILWQMIKYVKSNEYCILDDSKVKYVRKKIADWISDIAIPDVNGRKKGFSQGAFCMAINRMVKRELIVKFQKNHNTPVAYGIDEEKFIERIAQMFPYLNLHGKRTLDECEIDERA
jgi:hypothetical protein